jgi:hypothetical protein
MKKGKCRGGYFSGNMESCENITLLKSEMEMAHLAKSC